MRKKKSSRQLLKQTRDLAGTAKSMGFVQFAQTLRTACEDLERELEQRALASVPELKIGMRVRTASAKGVIVGFTDKGKVQVEPDQGYYKKLRTVYPKNVRILPT